MKSTKTAQLMIAKVQDRAIVDGATGDSPEVAILDNYIASIESRMRKALERLDRVQEALELEG